MPKEQSVIRRLLVKVCPQFLEDWMGAAGVRFRKGAKAISDYNQDHAQIAEKLDAAPGMLWRAAEGATSAQHAKAEADYAKAENDRMEAELRRRTLEAKTRHECADADKAEAEAAIAKIKEMEARIELYKSLIEAGVSVALGADLSLSILPLTPTLSPRNPVKVILPEDKEDVRLALAKVVFQPEKLDAEDFKIHDWSCKEGDRVPAGFPVCGVSALIPSSPVYTTIRQISAPESGTILEVLVMPGTPIKPGDVLATILPNLK